MSDEESIEIFDEQQSSKKYNQLFLNKEDSENVFKRNGKIRLIKVKIDSGKLI
jgi:predicted RNA-binding protein YlqC (UPF0109 family)